MKVEYGYTTLKNGQTKLWVYLNDKLVHASSVQWKVIEKLAKKLNVTYDEAYQLQKNGTKIKINN